MVLSPAYCQPRPCVRSEHSVALDHFGSGVLELSKTEVQHLVMVGFPGHFQRTRGLKVEFIIYSISLSLIDERSVPLENTL